MCGIVGIVGHPRPPDPDLAVAMAEVLRHRGPDEGGHLHTGRCALAVRRLAIMDVPNGHQPVLSEDGSVVAVLNGEIYNFAELRADLEARGHQLPSRSDTEVLPHLYEEHGADFVDHLDGMFAIAVWDERRRRLVLVRDRLGKKPLYYTEAGGWFRFASEVKAFFADRSLARRPDLASLHRYLMLQYVPPPATAFEGIRSLAAGERLVLTDGRLRVDRYWSLEATPDDRLTLADAADRVRGSLRDAVAKRMRADVPIAAFLSGGVDSACVVATMAQLSDRPVRTLTIGFEDAGHDERRLAASVAQAFATEHSEHVVRPDVAGLLPLLVWHYDQPMGDDSGVPHHIVAREARREATVVLNGDGGDEAFAGYPRVREVAADPREDRLASAYAASVEIFREPLLRRLYLPAVAAAVTHVSTRASAVEAFPRSGDPLSRVLRADYEGRLAGVLLPKADVAAMAASLEGRSPMLDHGFVTMAAGLPAAVKSGPDGGKLALRHAFRRLVPDAVLDGRKRGFVLPTTNWFRGELAPVARSLLDSPGSSVRRLLRPEGIRWLLNGHERCRRDHGQRIFSLVWLELWLRVFVDSPPPLTPPAEVGLADL